MSSSESKAAVSTLASLKQAMTGMATSVSSSLAAAVDRLAHLADPLDPETLRKIDALFRAANFLTVGQIYLRENVLLREPLKPEHIKPRLLGHWGTSPGLSLLYVHMNHLINQKSLDAIYLAGPGHGGPALVAQTYLEGTYTEIYPEVTQDVAGMRKLFRQFSAPGGIPSHVSPNVPGSIHEGGELGYVLLHAFGAVMDNPNLIALAVVGDGEAETGPLEGSWKGISFINPVHDGAVLPVLHLNGYKIAGPTVMGREADENIQKRLEGHGYEVLFVEGTEPMKVHQQIAKALQYAVERIQSIQQTARAAGSCTARPRWPCIIMRTPKGWTGPHLVDGVLVEGSWRSHQVPLAKVREMPDHLQILEQWLKSYRPEELFDATGKLVPELQAMAPKGTKRMSAQPYANGGVAPQPLAMPNISKFAYAFDRPATTWQESTSRLGQLCRDLYALNPNSFRLFCPDETNSNRLGAVFDTQKRMLIGGFSLPSDEKERVGPDGRVMEVLSEHCCNGWLEGYTLTGRYGLFATYEAFAMIVSSMTLQHIKWLEVISGSSGEHNLPWRKDIPSLNVLLSSTCYRNDHNGFSHQGPSFLDMTLNKSGAVTGAYLPIDINTLLVTSEHVLASKNKVNIICQDKQPQLQYLTFDQARAHFQAKISRFDWASNDKPGQKPDIVIACCGDTPMLESLAATAFLRAHAPNFTVRFVNVLNLLALYDPDFHPDGLTHEKFNEVFTEDVDVVFAYHSYAGSLHQLIHRRSNVARFHVRGFREAGTTTTPFDMVVLNHLSRFHLVRVALRHTKNPPPNKDAIMQLCIDKLTQHKAYSVEHMEDMDEIKNWKWPY